jgi:tetratricopeptide (TPR) repeat protein
MEVPASIQQVASHSERGARQYSAGDYASAAQEFSKSLAVARSAENEIGIGTASLNLALALQRLGQIQAAEDVIDSILQDKVLVYPNTILSDLATKKAQLRLEAKDLDGAANWVVQAQGWCGQKCSNSARLRNLSARVALEKGDPAKALAELTVHQAEKVSEPIEARNGVRLRAAALLQLGDVSTGEMLLENVLRQDKDAADGKTILQDLQLLAKCSGILKHPEAERTYLDRALSVASGLNDDAAVSRIHERLDQLRRLEDK